MFLQELSQYSLQGLRVFGYVASMGSIAEAAGALGLTQPAVSLQIHSLEDHLRFPLFERKGRRNVLTPRGQALLEKLLPHLEKLESIILDAKESENAAKPELAIGAVEGVGEFWLSKRFHEFSISRQDLRLSLFLGESDLLEQKLLRGEVSVAITTNKLEHARVISQVLMDERLLPVGRKKVIKTLADALANPKEGFRPWEQVSWIGYGEPGHQDPWTLRWLESVGINVDRRFKYRHQTNSYPVIKELLMAGLGLCVAPLHTCEAELQSGDLVSLESKKYPALKNRLYVSWRDGSLNSIHQGFKDWLVKTAAV
ncbi:MAG: LysR family transcriptional regulator [Bdellovibrionales bacterium]|nr:LysR family transcriptional regulator [Bdellovibrionales bacterium]